jgi:hypothetical protein
MREGYGLREMGARGSRVAHDLGNAGGSAIGRAILSMPTTAPGATLRNAAYMRLTRCLPLQ